MMIMYKVGWAYDTVMIEGRELRRRVEVRIVVIVLSILMRVQ
jgi:hypothetical protein